MSTPAEAAAVKSEAVLYTRKVQDRLERDLKAVPAEKQNVSPGGSGRTPLSMIAECAYLNGVVADYLAGREGKRIPREEQTAYFASFDTEEKALAFLAENTDALVASIEALDEETLLTQRDGFFGTPSTPQADALFPANHMMYHDGQINYIHTLYDDKKIYWG